jgi:hypothetical protein
MPLVRLYVKRRTGAISVKQRDVLKAENRLATMTMKYLEKPQVVIQEQWELKRVNTRYIAEEYRLSHWAGIVQERKDSGLSVKAYCESAGFHENRYYYWQKKLREAACVELAKIQGTTTTNLTPPGFVEITLPTQQEQSSATGLTRNCVCVESAGVRITAGGDYPADKLVALLREVMQPC